MARPEELDLALRQQLPMSLVSRETFICDTRGSCPKGLASTLLTVPIQDPDRSELPRNARELERGSSDCCRRPDPGRHLRRSHLPFCLGD